MENIVIRKLEKGDGKAIKDILISIEQHKADIDYEEIVEKEVDNPESGCFVAVHDGRVVGFMISYILSGMFGIANSAWLAMLGIHPKFMGEGIGKLLAKKIYEFCSDKGIKKIYTTVRWDSTDLLSFFKTLGFDRSNLINLSKNLE